MFLISQNFRRAQRLHCVAQSGTNMVTDCDAHDVTLYRHANDVPHFFSNGVFFLYNCSRPRCTSRVITLEIEIDSCFVRPNFVSVAFSLSNSFCLLMAACIPTGQCIKSTFLQSLVLLHGPRCTRWVLKRIASPILS